MNGCYLVPPSKCRQNKTQLWEKCERYIWNPSAAKVAREVTGNGNAYNICNLSAAKVAREVTGTGNTYTGLQYTTYLGNS